MGQKRHNLNTKAEIKCGRTQKGNKYTQKTNWWTRSITQRIPFNSEKKTSKRSQGRVWEKFGHNIMKNNQKHFYIIMY